METNARYVLIGLFSVLLAGAAVLFALWLGKASLDSAYHDYEVVFSEAVTGLSIGSPVQYSGIKVGDVQQLRLDPQDPSKVLVRIRVAADTPVRQNTMAKLTLAGITGTSFIQLSSGALGSPPLTASAPDQVPRIIAEPSPMSRLLSNGKDLLTSITELLANANRMFSPENAERIAQTLNNLQLTTDAIASQRDDLRQTIAQLARLSQQANQTLEQTSSLLRTSNNLLDKHGAATLQSAEQTMAALQRSSSIEHLLSSNQAALGEGIQGFSELGPALRELRATLVSLKGIAQRLEANPAGYLLGREQPQEFQP